MNSNDLTNDRFKLLFENSSDAHLIFDKNGITDCNRAAIELLNCDNREQLLSFHPAELSPETQPNGGSSLEISKEMDRIARENGMHRFEWWHKKVTGEIFPVEVTLNPIHLNGQDAMVVVWHDLTRIKEKEQQILKMNRELIVAKAEIEKDLSVAAKAQQALLPHEFKDNDKVKVAWHYKPSQTLGGDQLNVFWLDEDNLGVYLLDVSGHGIAASLMAVTVSHMLAPLAGSSLLHYRDQETDEHNILKPSDVVTKLNRRFRFNDNFFQYFTFFYGILNTSTYEFTFVNAGHPSPLLSSHCGSLQSLYHPGYPIGFLDEAAWEDQTVQLCPDDKLFLFSDGVPEAKNESQEQFQAARFGEIVDSSKKVSVHDSIHSIIEGVLSWCGVRKPDDDISIVGIHLRK